MNVSTDIDPESPADLDPIVAAALREYLNILEIGTPAARLVWAQRHADLMPQLECYLEGLRLIQEFSPPLRIAAAEIQDEINPEWQSQPLGDFQLLRRIGRGGMGVVYEAEQLSLRRRVAVKLLPFGGAFDSTLQQRFQRESQAAARLHHPHIVPVFTVGCERGLHFYVMQLIHGRSIAALIEELRESQSGSALPHAISDSAWFRRVARFGIQAAEGLHYAHEQGIVHRDIKPANLLLDERDELFVTDFGLASTQETADLTVSGHVTGTLRYASPEQVLGKRAGVDRRTDIYSLGATLYELLTLSPPFPGDDRRSLTHDILHTAPQPPRLINPSIPRDLETVIFRAMAGDQKDRYASASDLAMDLQRFQEGQAVHARRPGWIERTRRQFARRPRLATATFGVLLLLLVVFVFGSTLIIRSRELARESERSAQEQSARVKELQADAERQSRAAAEVDRQTRSREYAERISNAWRLRRGFNVYEALPQLNQSIPEAGEEDLRGFEWHHLRSQCVSGTREFAGHEGEVYWLAWSPDSTRIATASQDRTVRVWDLFAGTKRTDVDTTPVSRSPLKSILRSLDEHPPTLVLRGHGSEVNCVTFSNDGRQLASASDDETIRIWQLDMPDHFLELKGHDCPVVALAYSPQTGMLISGDNLGRLFVWNPETGEILSQTQAHPSRIECLAFSNDGLRIVTAGSDSTVGIWDAGQLPSLTVLERLTGHKGSVYAVAWASKGYRVLSGGWDRFLRTWEAGEAAERPVFKEVSAHVQSVCFSPDDRFATTSTYAGFVHQFDSETGELVDSLFVPDGRCWCAKYSPDGKWLAAVGKGKKLTLWPASPEERHCDDVVATDRSIRDLDVSPDGRFLVTVEEPEHLVLRSAENGDLLFQFPGSYPMHMSCGFGPNGELFTTNTSLSIESWDLTQHPPVKSTLPFDKGPTNEQVATSADHKFLIRLNEIPWNLQTQSQLVTGNSDDTVTGMAMPGPDPDCIPVFHYNDGNWWYPFEQKKTPCKYLQFPDVMAFSLDGQFVFTTREGRLIYELKCGESEPQRLPHSSSDRINDLTISPDGRTLVSAGDDGLQFWNLTAWQEMMSIQHPGEFPAAVAFLPGGRTIVYATNNRSTTDPGGKIRFLRLPD